jgi:hypothetical protein
MTGSKRTLPQYKPNLLDSDEFGFPPSGVIREAQDLGDRVSNATAVVGGSNERRRSGITDNNG